MLQLQSVPRATLDVLRHLSGQDYLKDFRLVGGTALALYWGHRVSVDLDFFTDNNVNLDVLEMNLEQKIEGAKMDSKNPIGRSYTINNVVCDFLNYPYRFQHVAQNADGIQLGHIDDVVTLKLGALANRGAKKGVYDLYYILHAYTVPQLSEMYKTMYRVTDVFPLLKSLVYFGDAEEQLPPHLIKDKKLTCPQVKKFILNKVNEYVK